MKRITKTLFMALILSACQSEPAQDTPCVITPEQINGAWDIALYFDPGAEPSSTEMVLNLTDSGELEGSFYGTEFETAKLSYFREKAIFTVITSDGTGEYITTGTIGCEAEFEGQTLSRGRDFLMPWVAQRKTGAE